MLAWLRSNVAFAWLIVRGYALETLADDDAVLVFDETGFLKQGKASCGVARQYTGKPIAGSAESVAQGLAASDWKRLSAGDGVKGPRLYDGAFVAPISMPANTMQAVPAFGRAAF